MSLNKEQSARDQVKKAIRKGIRKGILIRSKKCVRCKKIKKTESHHPDYDRPLDVRWLCRSCHMIIDGRMDKIHIKEKQLPKKCSICGRLSKPLRKGRCGTCAQYFFDYGIERPYIRDGRTEKYQMEATA